jgi:general secretion pathway protein D
MTIKPPVICACVLAAAAAIPTALHAANASPGYSQVDSGAESVADRTVARKEEDVRRARAAIESGDAAMKQRDYETAFAQYKAACDLLPESDVTHHLRADALNGLDDAACSLAEQRISEGRYEDAQNLCKAVLDPQYDPNCHRAIVLMAHLEDPDYYNKTITPRFRGNIEAVKDLFIEAKGYEQTGQYDKAYQDYDKILNLDPYNNAARKGQEEVNELRDQYATEGYNETRSELLWQLDNGWQMPVHKFGVKGTENFNPTQTDVRHTEYITNKLNRIIIPKISFVNATIREAIDFLKQKSVELDTQEPDPERRGVNIVLQLDTGGEGVSAPQFPAAPPAPAAPTIPGLEAAPAPGGAAVPAISAPTTAAVSTGETPITLSLSNIPLIEALKYVCQLAGLKLKIDPYAVTIVPPSVNTDELITKEYKVPASFLSSAPDTTGAAATLNAPATRAGGGGAGGGGATDTTGAGEQIANRQSAMDFFTGQGVQFPPGANAIYFPGTSRLIVHNTASNIELIDDIVESMSPPVPTQVAIESKFVEIQQQNQKELTGNVLLGEFNLPWTHNLFAAGGTVGTGTPLNASDFPLPFPSSGVLQEQPLSSGLRSGSFAISADAIDALLFPSATNTGVAPAIFGVGSVMTDPTFQAVLRGLDQKKGVDLLDAPRVTTKSGQRAVIEIVREFRYPTEFDPPQIPQTFGGGTGTFGAGGGAASVFPVTPTTPTAFETRNTGVTLEVEPTVGSDNYTIDLNLVPQVVEFEGFINYGSPISTINPATLGAAGAITSAITNAPTNVVLTNNVINQPIFSTRKVTTSVTVWDGQTVVLGGLMEDDVQKVQDKVPILGDVPILGRMFRSNVDQHLKTNLVIFVTAHLINPAGDNILDLDEKDETVEPLPLPSVPVQPEPEAPLFQK